MARRWARGLRKALPWAAALYLGRAIWMVVILPIYASMMMSVGGSFWEVLPEDQPGVAAFQRVAAEGWFPSRFEVELHRVLSAYGLVVVLVLWIAAIEGCRRWLQREAGWHQRRRSWSTLGLAVLVMASAFQVGALAVHPLVPQSPHDFFQPGYPREPVLVCALVFPLVALACRWLIHRKAGTALPVGFRGWAGDLLALTATSVLATALLQGCTPNLSFVYSHWVNPPGVILQDETNAPAYFRYSHHFLVLGTGLGFVFVRHLVRHVGLGRPLRPDRTVLMASAFLLGVGGVYWGDAYLLRDHGRRSLVRKLGLASPAQLPLVLKVEARQGEVRATVADHGLLFSATRRTWGGYQDEQLPFTQASLDALEGLLASPAAQGSTYVPDAFSTLMMAYRAQGRTDDYLRLLYRHVLAFPSLEGMARGTRRFLALTPVDGAYRRAAALALAQADPMSRDKVLLGAVAALRMGDQEAANRLLSVAILNGWALDTAYGGSEGKSTLSAAGGIDQLTRGFRGMLRAPGTQAGGDAEKDSTALVQNWFTSNGGAFQQEGELKGTVLLDGRPPREGWIDLTIETNGEGVRLGTRLFGRRLDPDGGFHLEGLVPGTYALVLRFPGGEPELEARFRRALLADGKTAEVQVEGLLGGIGLGRGHQRLDLGVIQVRLGSGGAPAAAKTPSPRP